MAKQARQKLKLLYLQKLLLEQTDEQNWVTMESILTYLEQHGIKAERKSIYDDMQTLQSYGMDIRQHRGKNGGYYIGSRTFETAELKLLVDAIQSSRFITHRKSRELIRKLESLTSRRQAAALQRQVYVAGRSKTLNESSYSNIDTLHQAISEEKQIVFRYFEWKLDLDSHQHIVKSYRRGGGSYQISPWALIWDDENYYLVGFDAAAQLVKHYRVDKMESIEIAELPREGAEAFEGFDLAAYTKKFFGMFHGDEQRVRLRCENRFVGVMHDRFGDDVSFFPCDEGHFYANINVTVSPQFFGWVFGLGGSVQIDGPQNVVEESQNLLKKFFNRGL